MSIRCPQCGNKSYAVESYDDDTGGFRRRRRCRACGFRFSTREAVFNYHGNTRLDVTLRELIAALESTLARTRAVAAPATETLRRARALLQLSTGVDYSHEDEH